MGRPPPAVAVDQGPDALLCVGLLQPPHLPHRPLQDGGRFLLRPPTAQHPGQDLRALFLAGCHDEWLISHGVDKITDR